MKKTLSETLNLSKYHFEHQAQEVLLQDVNRGSKTAAFGLIDQLRRNLVKDPYSISEPVREWLVKCLTDIAFNKVKGKTALGLSGKAKLHDPEHIIHLTVDQVYQYIKNTGLPLHKSSTSPSAFLDAATKFNISVSTAEKYYYFALKNHTVVDEDFLRNIIGLTDEEIKDDNIMNHYPIGNRI